MITSVDVMQSLQCFQCVTPTFWSSFLFTFKNLDHCVPVHVQNFNVIDEIVWILVVVIVSESDISFSFHLVDKNYQIFVVVVVAIMMNIILFSSTKIFVFVVFEEKNTGGSSAWMHKSGCMMDWKKLCAWSIRPLCNDDDNDNKNLERQFQSRDCNQRRWSNILLVNVMAEKKCF